MFANEAARQAIFQAEDREMTRRIKLRMFGTKETKELSLEEAEKILEEAYTNQVGGIVIDTKTNEVLWRIGPEVEEIMVVQMMGGG